MENDGKAEVVINFTEDEIKLLEAAAAKRNLTVDEFVELLLKELVGRNERYLGNLKK